MLIGAGLGAALVADIDKKLDQPMALPPGGALLSVARGDTLRSIARELVREGWIATPLHLALLGRFTGDAQRIKTGEFAVPEGTSQRTLLARLVHGDVIQHSIMFIEGWTFARVLAEIQRHPAIEQTIRADTPQTTLALFGLPEGPPEGQIMPDTYRFTRGTRDVDIIRRAHKAMSTYLERAWRKRESGLPFATSYEALILASIVEKETGLSEERSSIAGVFVRRLKLKMRLETDPTVIYGLGPAFDGNLRRSDLRTPTPYNTYMIKGLPPTPISLPSRGSIDAVLHPAAGDTLFFVARGDGSHQFSRTFSDHQIAVDKYQRRSRPSG